MTALRQEALSLVEIFPEEQLANLLRMMKDMCATDAERKKQREMEMFSRQMDEARAWAASVGYVEEDVSKIIKEVRKRARA